MTRDEWTDPTDTEASIRDHVRVEVERVPPEEPPTIYYLHTRCFDRCQDWRQG